MLYGIDIFSGAGGLSLGAENYDTRICRYQRPNGL